MDWRHSALEELLADNAAWVKKAEVLLRQKGCRDYGPEDVVAEGYLRVLTQRRALSIRPCRERLNAWFRRILHSVAIDLRRHETRTKRDVRATLTGSVAEDALGRLCASSDVLGTLSERKEIAKSIWFVLNQLSVSDRDGFLLHHNLIQRADKPAALERDEARRRAEVERIRQVLQDLILKGIPEAREWLRRLGIDKGPP